MVNRPTLTETPAEKAARESLSDNPVVAFFQMVGNIFTALFEAIRSAFAHQENDDSEMPEGQRPAGRVAFTIDDAERLIGSLGNDPKLRALAEKYSAGVPQAISPFSVKARITSHFGEREPPRDGHGHVVGSRHHQGIDAVPAEVQPSGTLVHATMPGVVVRSETQRNKKGEMVGYGHWVEIAGFDGNRYRYAHLKGPGPARGTVLDQGEMIGFMGASGHGTGAHLHYEVRNRADEAVAPLIAGRRFARNDRSYVGQTIEPSQPHRYASVNASQVRLAFGDGTPAPLGFVNSSVKAAAVRTK